MEILFGNYCYWLAQSACQDNSAVVYPPLSSAQPYAPQAFAMPGNSLPTCWIGSDLVATGLVPRLNRLKTRPFVSRSHGSFRQLRTCRNVGAGRQWASKRHHIPAFR
jgi:hypothetical protein